MKPDKILSLIGLATKAGRCVSGEFMTERETKCGRATLVIVAEDSSDNTKKKFRDMCEFYKVGNGQIPDLKHCAILLSRKKACLHDRRQTYMTKGAPGQGTPVRRVSKLSFASR